MNQPVVALSYYATHPQSYYRKGIPNPDFPGIARFMRQLVVPHALHIHFDGAGGNIGAGKYNDGFPENRLILAERLADGMKPAWEATEKQPILLGQVDWKVMDDGDVDNDGDLDIILGSCEMPIDNNPNNTNIARWSSSEADLLLLENNTINH